jgi:hypothetical protein
LALTDLIQASALPRQSRDAFLADEKGDQLGLIALLLA